MTLKLRFFEVGHGDSILIEHVGNDRSRFVVIDCNSFLNEGTVRTPVADYLRSREVQEVEALVVTHFDADHYFGIERILDEFPPKKVVIPPVLTSGSKPFKALIDRISKKIFAVVESTSNVRIGAKARSLAYLIVFLSEHEDLLEEASGPQSPLVVPAIPSLKLTVLLPFLKIRGQLRQLIEKGDFELNPFPKMNDASIVLFLEYEGKSIALTGDATAPQWTEHARVMRRDGRDSWDADAMKAPHHGSKHNNTAKIIRYVLGDPASKPVVVSADGITHPADEFFDLVRSEKFKPYCTNLARQCAGIVADIGGALKLPEEMRKFVVHYRADGPRMRCQGDVVIQLDATGVLAFNTTGMPCIYDSGMESRAIA